MWRAVFWLLLTPGELFLRLPFTLGITEDVVYEDTEDANLSDDDFVDFYETESTGDVTSTMTTKDTRFHTRLRRFGDQPAVQTRSHYDIQELKGVLKEIMANRGIETLTTIKHKIKAKSVSTSDKKLFKDTVHDWMARRNFTYDSTPDNEVFRPDDDNSYENDDNETENNINRPTLIDKENDIILASIRPLKELNEFKDTLSTQYMKHPNRTLPRIKYFKPINVNENADSQEEYYVTKIANTENEYVTAVGLVDEKPTNIIDRATRKTKFRMSKDSKDNAVKLGATAARIIPHRTSVSKLQSARKYNDLRDLDMSQMLTIPSDIEVATRRDLDMPALLDIITNLTLDYGDNLTKRFNETFQMFQIPTCESQETVLPTEPEFNTENATVIAKCFVCGLTSLEIPRDAYCADAFAGDFLPLVPVDPRARGQIARYRKYCQYMDVSGVKEFPTEPRSLFGRFTGGCSVRWIDLSGVYTQRACRNRRRAHTGKHFLSKRMAKLEMALSHIDNGCIVSPMATLVPLSRGISLYARFHACVCTGSWCNRAASKQTWIVNVMLVAVWTLEGIFV